MKSVLQPFLVCDHFVRGTTVNPGVVEIRILRRRMISPDGHVRDRANAYSGLLRQLRAGAVFVQSGHGEPAVARNFFRIVHRDQAIGVARISDYQHANIGRRIFLNRLTLPDENLAVDPEQILTFHARLTWHASDQQCPIRVAKTFIEVGRRYHRFQERERAIVQFHDDAFERPEHSRDLYQMKSERLIGPEHLAGGDAKQKRVTNVPGGAGHSDFNRSFHGAISHKRFVEQSQLQVMSREAETSRELTPTLRDGIPRLRSE